MFGNKISKVNAFILTLVLLANVFVGSSVSDNIYDFVNSSSGQTASAKTLSEIRNEKENISDKLDNIDDRQDAARDRIKSNREKAAYYKRLADKSTKEYKELQEQLEYLEEVKRGIKEDIKKAKQEYKEIVAEMEKQVTTMYMTSSMSYVHMLIQSQSITDLISRTRIINNILEYDNTIIDEVAAKKEDLDYKLEVQKKQLEKINKQAAAKKKEMDRLTSNASEFNSKVANAQAYLDELEDMEDEMEAEAARLSKLISSMTASSGGGSAPSRRPDGKYLWPVPSSRTVTSSYGWRVHPIFKTNRFHSGIDIAASSGQRIVAIASGTVIIAGWQNGYGNTVSINHGGGMTTLAAHASKLLVSTGQKVKAGQTVALVGSTGWSTGPHCHFEVRINGSTTNPLGGYI